MCPSCTRSCLFPLLQLGHNPIIHGCHLSDKLQDLFCTHLVNTFNMKVWIFQVLLFVCVFLFNFSVKLSPIKGDDNLHDGFSLSLKSLLSSLKCLQFPPGGYNSIVLHYKLTQFIKYKKYLKKIKIIQKFTQNI